MTALQDNQTPEPQQGHAPLDRRQWLVIAAVAVASIVAFLPALNCGFVNYDDPAILTENARVQLGLTMDNVVWAFSNLSFYNWQPIAWLSHMLDVQLFGMEPAGHHLTSLLLHAGAAVALLLGLYRLTGMFWRSAAVALLFAVHPLRVESVVWIAERRDVLAMLFGMNCLWFYAHWARARKPWAYVGLLLCFLLGLASKPVLVTLPCILLLLDLWPLQRASLSAARWRDWRPLVIEKLPMFALTAVFCVVTWYAQDTGGAVRKLESPVWRVGNAIVSYCRYLELSFWPRDMFVPYPTVNLQYSTALIALGILLVITVLALWQARRRTYLLVGWLWFLGAAVPMIGLVGYGGHAMADRNTYLPSVGLAIMVVWLLADWTQQIPWRISTLKGAAAIVIPLLILLSWQQSKVWTDSGTLFRHTLSLSPNNSIAHMNLGTHLADEGNQIGAIHHFEQAAKTRVPSASPWINIGSTHLKLNEPQQAIAAYEQALAIDPTSVKAHALLGIVLASENESARAIQHFQTALEHDPQATQTRFRLARALRSLGQNEQAITHLQMLITHTPVLPEWEYELALAFVAVGQPQAAEAHLRELLEAFPSHPETLNSYGEVLVQLDRPAEARAQFEAALRAAPNHPAARANLSKLNAARSDPGQTPPTTTP